MSPSDQHFILRNIPSWNVDERNHSDMEDRRSEESVGPSMMLDSARTDRPVATSRFSITMEQEELREQKRQFSVLTALVGAIHVA